MVQNGCEIWQLHVSTVVSKLDYSPSPYPSIKRSWLFWDSYISVCIKNCHGLDFLEFDNKWHGARFRDIMNGGLNP